MSLGMSGGLGGSGGRIKSIHTSNLCLDTTFKSGMDVGGIVIGNSGIKGAAGGNVGLGCGCDIGCHLGTVIFLLAPTFLCPFLGRTKEVNSRGCGTGLGTLCTG